MSINLADQLISHRKRRQALEQLISFARQISSAGDSMEALQYITRPSQAGACKPFRFLTELIHHLKPENTESLRNKLAQTDKLLIAETELFLHLAELSEEDFFASHQGSDAADIQSSLNMLQKRLHTFRRKAQTNVALRLVLHERGVQLNALKLPISQEQLSDEVWVLRQKEHQCREKITYEIKVLITETHQLLESHHHSETTMHSMQESLKNLQQALKHLADGHSLEDLPFHIEVYAEMSVLPETFESSSAGLTPTTEPEDQPLPQAEVEESSGGFLHFFSRWLNSGVDVGWKDIKQQERRPPP